MIDCEAHDVAVIEANRLQKRVAELEAALRPLVSAARKREAYWSGQTAAVTDEEEAIWMGKAAWWRKLADTGDEVLSKR